MTDRRAEATGSKPPHLRHTSSLSLAGPGWAEAVLDVMATGLLAATPSQSILAMPWVQWSAPGV